MSQDSSPSVGDLFHASISKLIFGGKGLARLSNGLVVHIPYVVPGETIEGKILHLFRSYATAEVAHIIHPSPDRIPAKCSHFGVCGGCQLQHIRYEKHAEIKKGWLKEALASCLPGDVPLGWSSSYTIWKWRKKSVFHARRTPKEVLLGYVATDGKTLFSCQECPIVFAEEEKEVLALVRQALSAVSRWKEGDIHFFRRSSSQIAIHLFLDAPLRKEEKSALASMLSQNRHIEEVKEHRRGRQDVLYSKSKGDLFIQVQGLSFHYSEHAFIQTHPEQPLLLWQDFVHHMKEWKPESFFLDLYSGIGVTASLAAQQKHNVTAVELSQEAVEAAVSTKAKERLETLRPICASVEKFLRSAAYSHTPWDTILINPPRQGLTREVLESMMHAPASELHYISCHPATLRRDLMTLFRGGWHIVWAKGYDMFPQTAHFETYLKLRRR